MGVGRILLLVVAMFVLAALDMVGALFAKSYADRHRALPLVIGAVVFVALFLVYAIALKLADLSVVTMGWIVLLQVGLLAVDRHRFGLELDGRQWAAVAAILVLQCYLVATAGSPPRAVAGSAPSAPTAPSAAPPSPSLARAGARPVAAVARRIPVPRVAPPSSVRDSRPPGRDGLPTPYLTIDLDCVADRHDRLAAALPGVALHYAAKANPAPEVLALLARRGAAFDVASPGEIVDCLRAGASPGNLSYGNTAKKERDIAFAVRQGVRIFTFDDATELAKLDRAAPGATVCCRLSTSGRGADWSLSHKFGCPPDTAYELLAAAASTGHPVGVAFHVGSQQRDPEQWDEPLHAVGRLQKRLSAAGVALSVLDLGGGFPGSYRQPTAPIEDYGRAITGSLRRHLVAPVPRVIAEPGRYLVADAGVIESEVVLVAQRGGDRWVHLDIGLFGGLAEAMDEAIQYRIETSRDGEAVGPVVLAGPTCDSVDILYRTAGYRLPLTLAAGDRVRLLSTGAYTASYASVGFNGLPPLAVRCLAGRSAALV